MDAALACEEVLPPSPPRSPPRAELGTVSEHAEALELAGEDLFGELPSEIELNGGESLRNKKNRKRGASASGSRSWPAPPPQRCLHLRCGISTTFVLAPEECEGDSMRTTSSSRSQSAAKRRQCTASCSDDVSLLPSPADVLRPDGNFWPPILRRRRVQARSPYAQNSASLDPCYTPVTNIVLNAAKAPKVAPERHRAGAPLGATAQAVRRNARPKMQGLRRQATLNAYFTAVRKRAYGGDGIANDASSEKIRKKSFSAHASASDGVAHVSQAATAREA